MSDPKTRKQVYAVSRRQVDALLSKAGKESVDQAPIQNGSAPPGFTAKK